MGYMVSYRFLFGNMFEVNIRAYNIATLSQLRHRFGGSIVKLHKRQVFRLDKL